MHYRPHMYTLAKRFLGAGMLLPLLFASCSEEDKEGGQLTAPAVLLIPNSIGIDGFGIRWSEVTGASAYEIHLDGTTLSTQSSTAYTFTGLNEATTYTAGVRALSDTAVASEWNEIRVRTYSNEDIIRLGAPELTVETASLTPTSFTVTWSAVSHADRYTWTLDDGQPQSTAECRITCTGLTPASSHTLRVRAEAGASNYTASEWSEIRVRTASEDSSEIEVPEGYRLVWSDEFDGTTLDGTIWNIEVDGSGGGNNELQYYCEKGVSVGPEPESGANCLILTATRENYQNRQFTSGRINSKGKYSFTYGRLDARIRMPQTANGLWPAFWLMGNDFDQVGWPACGETDIVEMGHATGISRGTQDRFFNGACHWGTAWNSKGDYALDTTAPYSMQDGFHLYTCIWTEDEIAMYYDLDLDPNRKPYYRISITRTAGYESDPLHVGNYFHKPNFILFNLAVGGNFPGLYEAAQITALNDGPAGMYVDYVRLYAEEQ